MELLAQRDVAAIILNGKEIPWFGVAVDMNLQTLRGLLAGMGLVEKRIGPYFIWDVPGNNNRIRVPET